MAINQTIFVVIILVLSIWLGILSYLYFRAFRTYKILTEGIDKKDVASILKDLKKHNKTTDKTFSLITDEINSIHTRLESHIQKLGFVRYNPFGNTGGDQSFCLCLLDEFNNGILITSLHTRQQTRIYTKELIKGVSSDKTELSKEENQCLKQAKSWSKV